jgi:hypothetical protein
MRRLSIVLIAASPLKVLLRQLVMIQNTRLTVKIETRSVVIAVLG